MSDPNGVQLICFDLGRVLVRICDNWKHAFQLVKCTDHVQELDPGSKAKLHALVVASETGKLRHDEFCSQAAPLFGVSAPVVSQMTYAYTLDVFPGAMELLDAIRSRGLKSACLSNTNSLHWQFISSDEGHPSYIPREKFDYPFASHLIGHRKPDAAIYEYVEQVTGLKGSQILFFDDLKENIEGARSRAWHAEQILPGSDPIGQIRNHLAQHKVLV